MSKIAEQDSSREPTAFRVFMRVYRVLTPAIFVLLLAGFLAQSSWLAEQVGALNQTIWNDVRCAAGHVHVPPMLMVIYIVRGVFLLAAANDLRGYASFLAFTMWANLTHGALAQHMTEEAGERMEDGHLRGAKFSAKAETQICRADARSSAARVTHSHRLAARTSPRLARVAGAGAANQSQIAQQPQLARDQGLL
ncbi:MAG: hypothetical protein ACRDTS_00465 [Mycobacterium sp.]